MSSSFQRVLIKKFVIGAWRSVFLAALCTSTLDIEGPYGLFVHYEYAAECVRLFLLEMHPLRVGDNWWRPCVRGVEHLMVHIVLINLVVASEK